MSLLALLLTLLLPIVNGATKLWRINENRVDSFREARAALNLIASDLSSICAAPNKKLFYSQNDNQPSTPTTIEKMDGSIFFLSSLPVEFQDPTSNRSDLCTIGYFLGFNKTSLVGANDKGKPSYNLYRYFRNSDPTFLALSDGNLLKDVVPDTSATAAETEVVAKNITSFTVSPYTIPSYDAGNAGANRSPKKFQKSDQTPFPDMLEVTIKSISNEAAKRFDGKKSQWEDPSSLTRRQDERIFTTRVYLSSADQVKTAPPSPPTP